MRNLTSPVGPDIRIVGVGGGGCNAITRMMERGIFGVSYIAMDTDSQKLRETKAEQKVALGQNITGGLGAGGDVGKGRLAAEQSYKEIKGALDGADMIFITAALGGGTGTGAAPFVAQVAREVGALTMAVVTTPFEFERKRRMQIAQQGIQALSEWVNAYLVIHNQRLFQITDRRTTLLEAFQLADDVLRQAVQGIAEVVTRPGLINVDFADVRAVLQSAGPVLMGLAEAPDDRPAEDIVKMAVSSPLLDSGIIGATNLLLNMTISPQTPLHQVYAIADAVARETCTEEPNIHFGAVVDPEIRSRVRLTVIATAFVSGSEMLRLIEEQKRRLQGQNPSPALLASQTPLSKPLEEPELPQFHLALRGKGSSSSDANA